MKKKQKKSTLYSYLVFILIGAVIGFLVIFIPTRIMDNNSLSNSGSIDFILYLGTLFFSMLIATYIQIIIHETGHLVCGLLSGYKFVSFRIRSFTLIKKAGKYSLKTFKVPGTGGQCLMMPPELINGNLPYKLYNLGGTLFNIIFSTIAILCLAFLELPVTIFSFLLIFSILGILFALLNGIPMKLSGIANDGYNIKSMAKDNVALRIFYLQLKINGLQTEGVRLKDMPDKWFEVPENINLKDGLHLSLFLFISARYFDKLDFEKARQCLNDIETYAENLIGLYQKERTCELLFFEIIGECRPEVIKELYTDDIETYVKQFNKYMFSKKRLLYTYTIAVEKDSLKAEKIFKEAIKMQASYPLAGDADTELEIMEYVRKRFL